MTTRIEGVVMVPLKKVVNERGHLMEIQRLDDSHFLGFGQVYATYTLPGITKAWYRHHKQVDQIALVAGSLLLALFDSRPNSSTSGQVQEIRIEDKSPLLVQIPVEVWHGFRPLGEAGAHLLHLNTRPFSFEDPDEDRVPWNDPSIPYRWPE